MKSTLKQLFVFVIILVVIFSSLNKSKQNEVLAKIKSVMPTQKSNQTNNGGGGFSNENVNVTPKVKKTYSKEAVKYFNEIALGDEFGDSSTDAFKRTSDVKIFVQGDKKGYLMDELKNIVSELNDIIETINISITNNKNEANTFIYFGSSQGFDNLYPQIDEDLLVHNWGYFEIYQDYSLIYVDIYRATEINAQKHLLREELTQSLGLSNDSYSYPESIFYQGWTTTTEFAPIDRELIDMLYNN